MSLKFVLIFSIFFTIDSVLKDTSFLTISAVGDIMMGSDYPTPLLPPDSGKSLFKYVKNHLKADIIFGNLEGVFAPKSFKPAKKFIPGKKYVFRMPPFLVSRLKEAGFNLISLANNHSFDFGYKGYKFTKNLLEKNGIKTGGKDTFAILQIKGLKIGFIDFSTYDVHNNILREKKAIKLIKKVDSLVDILIISVHGGREGSPYVLKEGMEYYLGEKRGNLYKFSHLAIDNGADIVLCHGPHVVRGLEVYKNRIIAYSLGNFCTYKRFRVSGIFGKSMILKLWVNKSGEFILGEIIPVYLNLRGGIPVCMDSAKAVNFYKYIEKLSSRIDTTLKFRNYPYIER